MSARNIAAGPVEIFVSGSNELTLDRDELKTQLLTRLATKPAFRDSGVNLDLFYSGPVETAAEMAALLERLTTGIRIFLRFLPIDDQTTVHTAPVTPEIAAQFAESIRGLSQAAVEQAWAQQQFAGFGGTLLLYRQTPAQPREANPDPGATDLLVISRTFAGMRDLLDLLVKDIIRAWEHYLQAKSSARARIECDPISRPAQAGRKEDQEQTLPLDEVQFTVYKPRTVQPGRWYTLLAFAHLADRPPDAAPFDLDPAEEVSKQASQILGDDSGRYSQLTQDSSQPIPRQGELTFVPSLERADFNPPRRSFLWTEAVHREEFRFRVAESVSGSLRGRVTVFLGAIIVAELPLTVRVESPASGVPAQFEIATARPYRRIFPSYSHRDAAIVAQFERYAQVLGDEYLRDAVHLRTGQVWTEELRRLIQSADIFQLFWSNSSMRSRYVREEWEYALSLQRGHFIRPTYWEEPFPAAPEEDLPPVALQRLHFQRLGAGRLDMVAAAPTEDAPHWPSTPPVPPQSPPAPAARPKRKPSWLAALAVFVPVLLVAFFVVRNSFLSLQSKNPTAVGRIDTQMMTAPSPSAQEAPVLSDVPASAPAHRVDPSESKSLPAAIQNADVLVPTIQRDSREKT